MIKTLGAYVKEFKRASIATPCYMILEVLMEMMIPYLMASIIDDGVNKGDMKHICVVGAGMLVIAAIGLFAGIMGGVYGAGFVFPVHSAHNKFDPKKHRQNFVSADMQMLEAAKW